MKQRKKIKFCNESYALTCTPDLSDYSVIIFYYQALLFMIKIELFSSMTRGLIIFCMQFHWFSIQALHKNPQKKAPLHVGLISYIPFLKKTYTGMEKDKSLLTEDSSCSSSFSDSCSSSESDSSSSCSSSSSLASGSSVSSVSSFSSCSRS